MRPKYLIPFIFTVLLAFHSKYSQALMIFGPATFTQQKAVISYDETSKTETLVISPSFKELAPKTGLGYWKFDEGSGTTINDTLGVNKGFLIGNVRWQDPSTCKNGACLSFNNTNEYVSIPINSLNLPPALTQLTLSVWVNPSNLTQPSGAGIIAKCNGGGNESFALDILNNDQLRFFTWSSGRLNSCVVYDWLASHTDKWTNILVTYDGLSGTATIYENAKQTQKCEGFPTNLSTNSHVLSIGSRQSSYSTYDLYFDGLIDDVRLYNYVVDENKISDIYDLAVLESNDEEALSNWLKENNYFLPKNSEFVLKEYIEKRYYFVVAKVNPDSISPFVAGQIREGHLNPIKMTFTTDQPVYPIKLAGASMATVSSKSDINYIDSGVVSPDRVEIPPRSYEPQPVNPAPDYYKPTYSSTPVVIYTISQDKQYLPGFNTEYAGVVAERKIENLATNSADKPWIDVKGQRYLTKLSKYMTPYEMNNDLVLRKADDNEPVGSGEGSLNAKTKLLLIVLTPIALELLVFAYYLKKRRSNARG